LITADGSQRRRKPYRREIGGYLVGQAFTDLAQRVDGVFIDGGHWASSIERMNRLGVPVRADAKPSGTTPWRRLDV
jgi:hypothetical protein